MKQLVVLFVFALFVVVLSGCTLREDRSWSRCELLRIAFDEQNELAPGWFDAALKEMKACGMMHYSEDAAKGRGRS